MWSSSLFTIPSVWSNYWHYWMLVVSVFQLNLHRCFGAWTKTGQVPQIGSGNHCPHCFLGACHGPGSGKNPCQSTYNDDPRSWMTVAVGWCLSSHSSQGSSEWSGQVLVGKIFAWSLAFFWKGWNPSHHWMELLRVNSGGRLLMLKWVESSMAAHEVSCSVIIKAKKKKRWRSWLCDIHFCVYNIYIYMLYIASIQTLWY